ncbi:murein biosynthesis integral membrane protein MurJ [Candidatus Berkelbacteria bacterium CG_4_9_14_0_2_um_filter_42_30]|uniref:Probable lipid II flippase MurJ n=6 Tax=Candidatus Berkelbacteria TaxID=1618330 RepID=A0A2M7K1Q3_9BACT|nr:MAG: murein biosynthesis integral membrane protein MurJ [Candidatus Berkelbacteria bacterium CG1_02_42_45]PIP50826.1 MAG: murein biosynthesis integral membrane protein MurJ [Candidatus Berkelbacteria bacterium CG23_combo_of_CG06-09_8_20_14_all_41_73]PIR27256.1 MAG: murein biosynthesis integral membrane protein MurJ [Candidatus Berkelbacteria bacterium CG11_big_fil_rev_8_21_14_0_20_42_15]PIX30164.1 MAG: murein biosynthesis integral membrane protein MurJ [Candidatus Berkelbacteria bacterium CG_
MWQKLQKWVHRENSLVGAAGILVLTMTLSNVLGLLRDHYLARNIETYHLDIYYAAFRIPDLIFNILIFGAISAAFIPVFTSYIAQGERRIAWRITNSLISISAVILLVLAIVFYFLMPFITPLLVPKFDTYRLQETTKLARILMLTPIFFSVSYFLGGVLNSFKRFVAYSFAPIVYNLAIIVGAIFVAPHWGINGVVLFVVAGSALHMLIQVPTVISLGYRYRPIFDFKHQGVRKIARLMIPRAIGMGANNILLFVYTAISSALAAGSIAVFNLANNIQTMPTVVFATSFSTAVFPILAHRASIHDHESFSSYLTRSMRVIVYLLAPSTVIFILLRAQIIRLILGSGKFGWSDTKMAALTLGWFSFSLIAQGLIPLFAKAFYARHDTKTPTIISVISIVISVVIAYPLARSMGVAGLALSFSIGSYINAILLYILLRKIFRNIWSWQIVISTLKIFAASVIMAVVVRETGHMLYNYVNMQRFWGVFVQAGIAAVIGLAVYLLLTYILGSQELIWALRRSVNGNGATKSKK